VVASPARTALAANSPLIRGPAGLMSRAPGRSGRTLGGKIGFQWVKYWLQIGFKLAFFGLEMALIGFKLDLNFSKSSVNID
jgi:hypothetical protein